MYRKLAMVGCITAVTSIIFGFVGFKPILEFGIRDQTALRKRNEIRQIYLKLPFPLDFRVYFFNISNPMEVQNGAKPVLKEIGPYCYNEYKEKIDVTDNEAEDSLTYYPYDIFEFNAEKSGNLTDHDYVTIINPLIVGMVLRVSKDSPALLSIVNQAIGAIFRDSKTIYLTGKVKDILFDGIEINCAVTEFAGKAVCTQIKSQIPGLKDASKQNVYLFSLLGTRNATIGKSITVGRGIKSSRDLGRLLELDGKRRLDIWSTKKCNNFKGTDGWILPPLLRPEEGIRIFSTELCRNVEAVYIKDDVLKGVDVRHYEADLGDMQNNERDKCYCPTPSTCLKRGVFDLSKCIGVPIYATLPHFLKADEIYLQQVEGMQPFRDNHTIKIMLEPLTGAPISAVIRMQLNIPLTPNQKISIMKNVPVALHPMFWIEEVRVSLEGPFLKKITNIFLVLKILKTVRWIGLTCGILVVAWSLYLFFKNRQMYQVTHIHDRERKIKRDIRITDNSSVISNNNNDNNSRGYANHILSGHEFDKYF